jgi:hypothetical protein
MPVATLLRQSPHSFASRHTPSPVATLLRQSPHSFASRYTPSPVATLLRQSLHSFASRYTPSPVATLLRQSPHSLSTRLRAFARVNNLHHYFLRGKAEVGVAPNAPAPTTPPRPPTIAPSAPAPARRSGLFGDCRLVFRAVTLSRRAIVARNEGEGMVASCSCRRSAIAVAP